jgi:putative transposase
MRTYVYKLRPTEDQETALLTTLETCRHLYNRALAERKEAWEQEQRSVTFAAQCAALPAQKRENPYLPAVHSQVLQHVLRRLDRAFENFFRRVKAGAEKVGYPRFRGRGRYDSFCYPQWGNGAKFADGRLVLSKLGAVRVCADRPLAGTPKTCAIVRKADGWYAHIACETADEALPATGESVGIDVGIAHFATLSTGETIANPRHYHAAERRLRQAQRRVSRRVKGSKRRAKARVLLAKAHLHVQRQRRDFAHKTALALVRRFDGIAVENLNIRGMLRNHALAKHIQDAGWGQFRQILSDKAASAGRVVVAVNPAGTSQACSACGSHVPKKLSDRWHSCPYCGRALDRDHNAALNIKTRGDTAFGEPTALAAALNREPHTL